MTRTLHRASSAAQRHVVCLATFASLIFSQGLVNGQSYVLNTADFLGLHTGKIQWIDLDNDHDLDLVSNGRSVDSNGGLVIIYENVDGSFLERNTNLPDMANAGITFGDYDKDGDMDVAITGLNNQFNPVSSIYENLGSFNFELEFSLPGVYNSNFSWADIDNDLDLDLLLVGLNDIEVGGGQNYISNLYENTGSGFSLIGNTNLPPCWQCSLDWADSNGDGKIDLLLSGLRPDGYGQSAIYLNNGDKTFRIDENSILTDAFNGVAKWGDYDNDGDMDILQNGADNEGIIFTKVYQNQKGVLVERSDVNLMQLTAESWYNSSNWVDFDNDGYLDIQIAGRTSFVKLDTYFQIYRNDHNGNFVLQSSLGFGGMVDNSVAFADYDNDGDLDISFLGIMNGMIVTGIYKNISADGTFVSNSPPSPPSASTMLKKSSGKKIAFSWSSSSDTQSPANGLSYNVYLRNDAAFIAAPAVNFSTGYLLTDNPANGRARKAWAYDLPEGTTYSWAVQSIDGGLEGSLFSPEKSFYLINSPDAVHAQILDLKNIKLTWTDNSGIETSYKILRSVNSNSDYSSIASLAANSQSYIDNSNFVTDTYYYYRISALDGVGESDYDSIAVVIPTAPTNLVAKTGTASRINLTWKDNSLYETGYVIERRLAGVGNFAVIDTVGANSISFIDKNLKEGTSYDYRIRAINNFGYSDYSNSATAKTDFRPTGKDVAKNLKEDTQLAFSSFDFSSGFSDPDVSDTLYGIILKKTPSLGLLYVNSVIVKTGATVLAAELNSLKYVPLSNLNGTDSFEIYYSDGKDRSLNAYNINLAITPVNDPPIFSVQDIINVDEDFVGPIIVKPIAGIVPDDEKSQTVNYKISPEVADFVDLTFNKSTGEITLTSKLNLFGEQELVLTADDGQSVNNLFQTTIKLVVNSVNDAPVFSVQDSINVNEDFTAPIVVKPTPGLIPDDEKNQIVSYKISPQVSDLVDISFDQNTGEVTFASKSNQFGDQEFVLTADDGQNKNNTFQAVIKLVVNPVNDAPVFSVQDSISADEDFIEPIIVKPTPGFVPGNEKNQVVSYKVSPSTSDLVDISVNQVTGEVTFTSKLNQSGDQEFVLSADDGQDKDNTFQAVIKLVVNPVNDPPVFSIPEVVNLDEDFSGPISVNPIPGIVSDDEKSQVVSYKISPETVDFVDMSFNKETGELTLTSKPNQFGEQELLLVADDGQSEDSTYQATVKIVVNSIDDPPVISLIEDIQIDEDASVPAIPFTISDADDLLSSIVLTTSSDNQLFIKDSDLSIQGDSDQRNLMIVPEAKQTGAANITVSADDGKIKTTRQFKFTVDKVTAIENLNPQFSVYPNPAKGKITIAINSEELNNEYDLSIHDILGREVTHHILSAHETSIALDSFSSGIYLIKIAFNGQAVLQTKFIKE